MADFRGWREWKQALQYGLPRRDAIWQCAIALTGSNAAFSSQIPNASICYIPQGLTGFGVGLERSQRYRAPVRPAADFLNGMIVTKMRNKFSRQMQWVGTLFAIGSLVLLGGCAGRSAEIGNAGGELTVMSALPEPAGFDTGQLFRLGADDIISVRVFGSPEASVERTRLDKSGRLSVPIGGMIEAGGMTVAELEDAIESALRKNYFRDPQVSISLIEIASSVYTVGGGVTRPGIFPARPKLTLMQAVAVAEGTSDEAKQNEVVVFRTIDGKKYAALYDLRAIRRGNYADPRIFPDDVVMVGEAASRSLFLDAVTAIGTLASPIILLLRN